MGKEPTSEEKLLKLIKKKPLANVNHGTTTAEQQKERFNVESLDKTTQHQKKGIDVVAAVNRLMMLVVVGIVFFLVYKFTANPQPTATPLTERQDRSDRKGPKLSARKVTVDKPFTHYQRSILRKDIFRHPWEPGKPGPGEDKTPDDAITGDVLNLQNNLILMGITLGSDSTAIIQDLQSQKTLFMSVGDEVYNAILVEIQAKKVIFEHDGEMVDIIMGADTNVSKPNRINPRNRRR